MDTATTSAGPLARLLAAPPAPSKWMTMVAVCVGLGMLMIDTFVVNVAFPAIGEDLDASLGLAEWTVSGYVLALGVLPLAMGRLGDLFGRRRVYLLGLAVFVASSGACGLAPNIETLIAFRVMQGAGAAVMMPGTLSIITAAFPPEQRGLAIGAWGGVSGLGLIAGPILGGVLVETGDWRWIFLVNLPLGLAALALGLRFVAETRDESAPPEVDWVGVGLLAAGLGAITFGLTRANEQGWTSPWMVTCFVAGPALVVAFVLFETRARYPLVDLSLFRSGTFVMACLSAFLFSAAVFGSQPFTSLFLQNYMGMSPIEGGLAFIPATVLVAALMPVSGVMGQRLGSQLRLIVIAGSLLVGVSFVALLWLDTDARYVQDLLPAFLLRGLGIGLFMSATSLATMSAVPLARAGLASGTLTMFRQLGTALGVAVLGAIFLHHIDATVPDRLAAEGVPAEQAAGFEAAAEHFVAAGAGDAHEAVRSEIVDGYVLLALYGIAISALAAAAAFFIRHSTPATRTEVPSPRRAADPALAPRPVAPGPAMNPDQPAPRSTPMTDRLELLQSLIDPEGPKPPIARLIGFEVVHVERGRAVVALDASSRHWNPMGTLHGGILADIADAAMGIAYTSTLDADQSFTTLELKINFLRPVRQARLIATGRVVQRGKSVGLVECDVVDETERLVARATSTCMTLRGQQAAGRQPGDWQSAEGAAAG